MLVVETLTELAVHVAQCSTGAQKWIRDTKVSLAGRLDLTRARVKNRASVIAQNNTMIIGSYDHNREGAKNKQPVEGLGYGSLEHRKIWPYPRAESFRSIKPRARMESNRCGFEVDLGSIWLGFAIDLGSI